MAMIVGILGHPFDNSKNDNRELLTKIILLFTQFDLLHC